MECSQARSDNLERTRPDTSGHDSNYLIADCRRYYAFSLARVFGISIKAHSVRQTAATAHYRGESAVFGAPERIQTFAQFGSKKR
jgi:hypothetical protein